MRSFIKTMGLLGCALAGPLACGASEDDSESGAGAATAAQIASAFDVNDVSILFPLKNKVPFPQIKVTGVDAAPAAQQIWTQEVWSGAIAEAERQGIKSGATGNDDFFKNRDLWQIVGLRFDPCAPGFSDAAIASLAGKCLVQIRLIAQPFTSLARSPADFTAHLVFTVGASDRASLPSNPTVQAMVKALGEIKDASLKLGANTSGQPLGVHPGLEAEASAGGTTVSGLVKNFVKTFAAGPQRAVAFMGLQNGGPEPWTFFAGKADGNAFSIIQTSTAMTQTAQTLGFRLPDGTSPDNPVLQKSKNPVNTAPLFGDTTTISAADKKLAFEVEDPARIFLPNADCVSCHTSSSRMSALSLGDGDEISARIPSPANITGYVAKTQSQDKVWNVRNFGYFFTKPTVSGRTVAETAVIAAWVNNNVRAPGAGLNGPGRDCSKVDAQVFKCFRDGNDDCLSKCAPPPKPTGDAKPRDPDPTSLEGGSGDPCADASIGGDPTVSLSHDGTSLVAKLGGNNAACLSRVLGGSFVGTNVSASCSSTKQCSVTITGADAKASATLKGAEEKRFRKFFTLTDGQIFASRGEPGKPAVEISCSKSECDVALPSDRSQLPPITAVTNGTLINP